MPAVNYQDKSLVVSYIQIYLKEYFGITLKKYVPRQRSKSPYYEITNNDPIKVTGYYNTQTYTSLALYMAFNYPEEGYPCRWKEVVKDETGLTSWVSEDFVYNEEDSASLIELIDIIKTNVENFPIHRETIQVPERVISYILGEVVTPRSSDEEILRIKKIVYSTPIGCRSSLKYEIDKSLKEASDSPKDLKEYVKSVQESYIAEHSEEMPEQFKDLKATGYVDPWTEVILKGGVDFD